MKAFAKINYQLYVINQKDNGYHNLQMVNSRINIYDIIKIRHNKKQDFVIYVNKPQLSFGNDDLIIKVIKCIKEKYNINRFYNIYIKKNIPIGAGLGGASMDVGTIVRYIIRKENLSISNEELIGLVKNFGADIPYGLYNFPCVVEGIGDIITKARIKNKKMILIYPNLLVSTKLVFSKCDIINDMKEHRLLIDNTNNDIYHNDLESIVFSLYPELARYKEFLQNYGKTFMTGSGSCLVLIPKHKITKVYRKLCYELPDCEIRIAKIKKGK